MMVQAKNEVVKGSGFLSAEKAVRLEPSRPIHFLSDDTLMNVILKTHASIFFLRISLVP